MFTLTILVRVGSLINERVIIASSLSLSLPSVLILVVGAGGLKFTLKEPEITAFLAHSIGLMFQDPHLIRELSVIENVAIKGVIAGMSQAMAHARASELLALFGLTDKETHAPSSLSGGQQQMVALARALVNKPKFILADEPTGNLDAESGKRVMDELVRCVGEGMGLIVCSHDPYVTKRMTTILSLKDGQLV